jgi:glycosyltransferase involved in cell wall biosynthesis
MPASATGSAPADSLNVLIVSHYFPPHVGGVENIAYNQAKHLAHGGDRVAVLTSAVGSAPQTPAPQTPAPQAPAPQTPAQPAGWSVTRIRAWNFLEHRLGVPFPIFSPALVWRSFLLVRDADVVHAHEALYMPTWIVALWCRLLRRPLLLHQHVHMVTHRWHVVELVQGLVFRTLGRLVLGVAARVVVLNATVLAFIRGLGVPTEKISVVLNGVDEEIFSPVADGEKENLRRRLGLPVKRELALFVGRFVPKKGFTRLLQAAGGSHTVVFVGGRAPAQFSTDQRFVFLGTVDRDHMADIYRACDVFVLPSEGEGFPLSVQEAMASGLPVITTDDPGYSVYGLDRTGVLLVEPTVDAVRAALHRLMGDPRLRRHMSSYSIDYAARHFRWREHIRRIREIYALVLGERATEPDRLPARRAALGLRGLSGCAGAAWAYAAITPIMADGGDLMSLAGRPGWPDAGGFGAVCFLASFACYVTARLVMLFGRTSP